MQRSRRILMPLPAVLLIAGCSLLTVNLRVSLDVPDPPGQGFLSTELAAVPIPIDMERESDFKDHKDKIKSVEGTGFVFEVTTGNASANMEIWASSGLITPPTRANIQSTGQRVLAGLFLNANETRTVGYSTSLELQKDQAITYLNERVKEGSCYLYAIASNSTYSIAVRQFTLVSIVNAGL